MNFNDKLNKIFDVQGDDSKRRKKGKTDFLSKDMNDQRTISVNPDDLPEYDENDVAKFPEKSSPNWKG